MWGHHKAYKHMHNGNPEREEKEWGKKIFEEIMSKIFSIR